MQMIIHVDELRNKVSIYLCSYILPYIKCICTCMSRYYMEVQKCLNCISILFWKKIFKWKKRSEVCTKYFIESVHMYVDKVFLPIWHIFPQNGSIKMSQRQCSYMKCMCLSLTYLYFLAGNRVWKKCGFIESLGKYGCSQEGKRNQIKIVCQNNKGK